VSLFTVHTIEENAQVQADFMPGGKFWRAKNIIDSKIRDLLRGFGTSAKRQEEALDAFWTEVFIGTTEEYIGDFERAVGIPDGCFLGTGTLDERRTDVISKLTSLYLVTLEDFNALADSYNVDIEILPGRAGGDDIVSNGQFTGDFDWAKGSGWSISVGSANKNSGIESSLSQEVSAIIGDTYFARYEIFDHTAGTLQLLLGGTEGEIRSSNGVFEEYIVNDEAGTSSFPLSFPIIFPEVMGDLEFRADAQFNGSIRNIRLNASIMPLSTARFTLVMEFPAEIVRFPLPFPIVFGNRAFSTLQCLLRKLKPSYCDVLFKVVEPGPEPPSNLFAWGLGDDGQLGQSNFENESSPVSVGTIDEDWEQVAAGLLHTLAINSDGELFAWGNNDSGQLGDGTNVPKESPIQIGTETDWDVIACGQLHSVGIRSGNLYAWGFNTEGQLGQPGSTANENSPVQMGALSDWVTVAASQFTIAINSTGQLFGCGLNTNSEIGLNNTNFIDVLTLVKNPDMGGATSWVSIACGKKHWIALTDTGSLWANGFNGQGQLGVGDFVPRSSPVQVDSATTWTVLSAGEQHSLGINSGLPFSWGNNFFGQLGLPVGTGSINSPIMVSGSTHDLVVCGEFHSLIIDSGKILFAFGDAQFGQLGNEITTNPNSTPVQIGTEEYAITDRSMAAANHSLGIRFVVIPLIPPEITPGELYAWGLNDQGQLGDGTQVNISSPVQIGSEIDWDEIAAGQNHTVAIKNGLLFTWGRNDEGQLGSDFPNDRSAPVQVGSDTWVAVAAGVNHSLAINALGELWAWGFNGNGQCGTGSFTPTAIQIPTKIGSATDWDKIDGGNHTLAGNTLGELWGCGVNGAGQLGDFDTNSNKNVLTLVVGSHNFITIAAGTNTSGAIDNVGNLHMWGQNAVGEMGDNDAPNSKSSPVQIGAQTDWLKLTGGQNHWHGIRATDQLFSWGSNTFGQLADDSPTQRNSPVQVGIGFNNVVAGDTHSIATTTSNDVFGWGFNGQGQVGDFTLDNRSTAVQIATSTGTLKLAAGKHSVVV